MRKKFFICIFICAILCFLSFSIKSYAADLDRITNYEVTVDPRMNDGTLDITYKITWKVLDSTTEGPLEWVQIGTPNSNFDNPTALTKNIKSISKYNGSYVRIDFDKAYHQGQFVTFKYSIHQSSMHKKSFSNCNFSFTPAWFTDIKIDKMTIKWNADEVTKNNADATEGKYLVWRKSDMQKGEKLTADVTYKKDSFATLTTSTQNSR